MAKELPYYKFEPNQWENGNIQICTREDKGLFIDLCSMYWSRLGDVPLKLAIQKLCGGNASAFDSLIKEDIFEVIDDMICIHFLNEQLSEFYNTSKQNSKNAKLRWEKHRKQKDKSERNASASIPQCENDAIREEKRREDNINYTKDEFLEDWNTLRLKNLKKPSFLNTLRGEDLDNFTELIKDYSKEDFQFSLIGLFKQKKLPNDQTSMQSNPKHFLKFFNTYLTAYHDRNTNLYGKNNNDDRAN